MYVARTQEEILAEMIAESSLPSSKIEGTFEHDVLASNSIEFAKIEVELAEMHQTAFGRTAWDDYLDYKSEGHGVTRRAAVKAIGKVVVTGNGIVEEGSYFQTTAGVRFVALETVEVIGSAEINIEAVIAGTSGNVAAEAINVIPMNIPGIINVRNPEPTYDGYDEEDDETLRERYLTKVRKPAASGNPREYEQWAMEVAGVGAARCLRTWNGPNTVKIVIVNSNFEEASDHLIQQVIDHINDNRPSGFILTVVSARQVPINIEAKIIGSLDREAFDEGLMDYFKQLTRQRLYSDTNKAENHYVSYAQVSSVIIVEGGADDHRGLKINGAHRNFHLSDEEFPVIGEVNFI